FVAILLVAPPLSEHRETKESTKFTLLAEYSSDTDLPLILLSHSEFACRRFLVVTGVSFKVHHTQDRERELWISFLIKICF
uniref:Uncharacterized protein n=1 Tax=Sus scrofa TaxID=9823 RepID=A0A4X1T717_PIG